MSFSIFRYLLHFSVSILLLHCPYLMIFNIFLFPMNFWLISNRDSYWINNIKPWLLSKFMYIWNYPSLGVPETMSPPAITAKYKYICCFNDITFCFFLFQLGKLFQMLEGLGTKLEKDGLLERYTKPELSTRLVEEWAGLTKKFMKVLPYTLTTSQLQATSEIIWDLKRPVPMNRLLQVWSCVIHRNWTSFCFMK